MQKTITGSIQVKKGMYYAVINIYENGKRKQKWVALGFPERGNKKRAEAALREQLNKYQKLSGLISTDILFSEYINIWLENQKNKIDIITFETYEKLVLIHIAPYFAERKLRLSDVESNDLQLYFDEKYKNGRKDGNGGLSPCSLRKHKNIINQVMKSAVKKGFIQRNFCEDVELPSIEKHTAKFYTEEQLKLLLEESKTEYIYPMILMGAFYGMRRSEICGLQWDSVNFEDNTITVKHTLVKHTSLVEKDTTKSKSSYRTYPLNEEIKHLLIQIQNTQHSNKKLLGKGYKSSLYIFTWQDGRPLTPDFLSHKFSKIIKKHKLPHISIHGLRHSCASLLLSKGYNLKDVQEWLGHADISMTANTYGHLDIKRKQSLANSMTSLFSDSN